MPDDTIRETAKLAASFLSGGVVGTFIGHRLSVGRDDLKQRRAFQAEIRVLAEQAGSAHFMYLPQEFERAQPIVQRLRFQVRPCVPVWKRRRFDRACDSYLGLTLNDLKSGGALGQTHPEKQSAKAPEMLKRRLNAIADAS